MVIFIVFCDFVEQKSLEILKWSRDGLICDLLNRDCDILYLRSLAVQMRPYLMFFGIAGTPLAMPFGRSFFRYLHSFIKIWKYCQKRYIDQNW